MCRDLTLTRYYSCTNLLRSLTTSSRIRTLNLQLDRRTPYHCATRGAPRQGITHQMNCSNVVPPMPLYTNYSSGCRSSNRQTAIPQTQLETLRCHLWLRTYAESRLLLSSCISMPRSGSGLCWGGRNTGQLALSPFFSFLNPVCASAGCSPLDELPAARSANQTISRNSIA